MNGTRPMPDALRLADGLEPIIPARLQQLRDQLSARDLAVLSDLGALHLMTARDIERMRFTEGTPLTRTRRAQRTLQRLHTQRLVARLERRVGGARAGSASYVYRLTAVARRLLGLPGPRGGQPHKRPESTRGHIAHVLAVAELAVTLHEAHRAGRLDLVLFQAEPASWRTYLGIAGEIRHVRPDAFAIIGVGDWEHLWFVEADLGSEPLATLHAKADAYRQYAATGHEQDRWGAFPRVAYLTHTPQRRDALTDTLYDDALATVATLHDATDALTATDAADAPAETDRAPDANGGSP